MNYGRKNSFFSIPGLFKNLNSHKICEKKSRHCKAENNGQLAK